MKTQHTPGPWIINEHTNKNFGIDLTEGKKGKVICNVTSHYIAEHKEAQANSRLIAAAPELLDALQSITETLHQMKRDNTVSGMLYVAELAIKKATHL